MWLPSWLRLLPTSRRAVGVRRPKRLCVESLEQRDCPSGVQLLISDWTEDKVLRYDATSGAFVDTFVTKHNGGLNDPIGLLFGPRDHNLYVSSGQFSGTGQLRGVPRYDGSSGAFIDGFTEDERVRSPRGIIFGPDGNLYVADATIAADGSVVGRVVRFDGETGAFMDDFVPAALGGLGRPGGLLFGPTGRNDGKFDLYVASSGNNRILRYDGTTGAFVSEFVSSASGWLDHETSLTFGPDGNLYVANWAAGVGHLAVLRFQGPNGTSPGSPMPSAGNNGQTLSPPAEAACLRRSVFCLALMGMGTDTLTCTSPTRNTTAAMPWPRRTLALLNATTATGAFIDTFISVGSGGLREPFLLTFTETDPVTLAYTGDRLQAAAAVTHPIHRSLSAKQVKPLLAEAIHRWQAVGVDTPGIGDIRIQITNLGGTTLASLPATPSGSTTTLPAGAGLSIAHRRTTRSSLAAATRTNGTAWTYSRCWSTRSTTCLATITPKTASWRKR